MQWRGGGMDSFCLTPWFLTSVRPPKYEFFIISGCGDSQADGIYTYGSGAQTAKYAYWHFVIDNDNHKKRKKRKIAYVLNIDSNEANISRILSIESTTLELYKVSFTEQQSKNDNWYCVENNGKHPPPKLVTKQEYNYSFKTDKTSTIMFEIRPHITKALIAKKLHFLGSKNICIKNENENENENDNICDIVEISEMQCILKDFIVNEDIITVLLSMLYCSHTCISMMSIYKNNKYYDEQWIVFVCELCNKIWSSQNYDEKNHLSLPMDLLSKVDILWRAELCGRRTGGFGVWLTAMHSLPKKREALRMELFGW